MAQYAISEAFKDASGNYVVTMGNYENNPAQLGWQNTTNKVISVETVSLVFSFPVAVELDGLGGSGPIFKSNGDIASLGVVVLDSNMNLKSTIVAGPTLGALAAQAASVVISHSGKTIAMAVPGAGVSVAPGDTIGVMIDWNWQEIGTFMSGFVGTYVM